MKYITLDLWKPYHAPIEVVQREAGARTLAFQITDGGVALDLTGKVVTFYATKPDDSIVFNACTVTGVGKCTYLLTAQTCAVVGDLSCTLVITGDGYEARTQPFTVTVIASPDYTSAVESTDEFTALAALAGDIASNTADIADIRAGGDSAPFAAMPYVGAVPIVESGSNANGNYVKYANGTMICRATIALGSIKAAGAGTWDDPFRTADSDWTFPVAFASAPNVTTTGYLNTSVSARKRYLSFYQNISTTTLIAVTVLRIGSDSSEVNANVSAIAIGAWK